MSRLFSAGLQFEYKLAVDLNERVSWELCTVLQKYCFISVRGSYLGLQSREILGKLPRGFYRLTQVEKAEFFNKRIDESTAQLVRLGAKRNELFHFQLAGGVRDPFTELKQAIEAVLSGRGIIKPQKFPGLFNYASEKLRSYSSVPELSASE